jgi:hypothetical protein
MTVIEPRLDVLPTAQRALWTSLRPVAQSGFVLYGGTAVALYEGHRVSIDFDFSTISRSTTTGSIGLFRYLKAERSFRANRTR